MITKSPVLDRLRAATAAAHQNLDARLDAIERLATVSGKRAMVPRYYRMHQEAERAVWPLLRPLSDLDINGRSRVTVLARDLAALEIDKPDTETRLPAVGGVAEALGFLYVLEGSTLGGRMIRGTLKSRGCDLTGLDFLDPYGSHAGARWRGFLAVLERDAADDVVGAERGAVSGFAHAGACLLEDVPA